MSKENVDVVRSIYDASAAGDIAGVLSCVSPNIIWHEVETLLVSTSTHSGPEGIDKSVIARHLSQLDIALTIDEVRDFGDTVVALGRYHGRDRPKARPRKTQLVHVWRLLDSRVVRFQQFAETLHVARVTGRMAGRQEFADARVRSSTPMNSDERLRQEDFAPTDHVIGILTEMRNRDAVRED